MTPAAEYFREAVIANVLALAYQKAGDLVRFAYFRDRAMWYVAKGLESLAASIAKQQHPSANSD